MLILTCGEALAYAQTSYPSLPQSILGRYAELIDLAWLFVVQPGDRVDHLQSLRGRPFVGWEFIELRDGWFEAVFVLSDDGFGHVVLIPDDPATDSDLLALCRAA